MARSGGGFLGVGHGCAPIIVFLGNRGGLLWNIQVPEDAADKGDIHPTSQAAINSASVEERATVGWNFVL